MMSQQRAVSTAESLYVHRAIRRVIRPASFEIYWSLSLELRRAGSRRKKASFLVRDRLVSFIQVLVYIFHCAGTLSNGRRHAFRRAKTDISDSEQSWHTGLETHWLSLNRPGA